MSEISCVCLLPGSAENNSGERTVYEVGDSSTAISVGGSWKLVAQGPKEELIAYTKIGRAPHSN